LGIDLWSQGGAGWHDPNGKLDYLQANGMNNKADNVIALLNIEPLGSIICAESTQDRSAISR
jgi:hypothetical protein